VRVGALPIGSGTLSSYQIKIVDATGSDITLYQGQSQVSMPSGDLDISIPELIIDTARVIEVTLTLNGTSVEIPREVNWWAGTTNDPSWATTTGRVIVDGVDGSQPDNAFDIDILAQPLTALTTEWQLLPSGGGGGGTSSGGVNHLIGDDAPTSGQGADGDMFLRREV
jgi:hypothetical protein